MTPPTPTTSALDLTLTPQSADGRVTGIAVEYVLHRPGIVSNAPICRLPRTIVGIPGAEVRSLQITDDAGTVPVREEDEPPTQTFTYRRWLALRKTVGDLHVSYVAPVRSVDANTKSGPLFDLRAEDAGLNGAGITFLALPDTQQDLSVTLSWDLTQLPPGSRAVSSLGDGTVHTTATVERLASSFYLAGPISRHPADVSGPFAMYWLTEPSFDIHAVATLFEQIYRTMCEFFREPDPGHRIFIRKQPYRAGGGTGFHRSFAFGHSDAKPQTVQSLTHLIAHETAHNWPTLEGEHGDVAWYTEGTAEYFSILLPYRAGIISEEDYLRLVNERARSYYTNPLQTLTNAEAAERFWSDSRAQRVPYGRGLFYLIDVNAKIRARSGGVRGLDDIVLEILERQRHGEKIDTDGWLELVTAELGEQGSTDFAAMSDGQWIVPGPDALGPRFTRHDLDDHLYELGFDLASLNAGVVSGLVPGSAADEAGVRGGDRIVAGPIAGEVGTGEHDEITLTLERDARMLQISYRPQGASIRSYAWQPVPAGTTQ